MNGAGCANGGRAQPYEATYEVVRPARVFLKQAARGRLVLFHGQGQAVACVETCCSCQGFAGSQLNQPGIEMQSAATTSSLEPVVAIYYRTRCSVHDDGRQVVETLRQALDMVVV